MNLRSILNHLKNMAKQSAQTRGKEVNAAAIAERVDFARGCVYSHNACFGALLDNLNFVILNQTNKNNNYEQSSLHHKTH